MFVNSVRWVRGAGEQAGSVFARRPWTPEAALPTRGWAALHSDGWSEGAAQIFRTIRSFTPIGMARFPLVFQPNVIEQAGQQVHCHEASARKSGIITKRRSPYRRGPRSFSITARRRPALRMRFHAHGLAALPEGLSNWGLPTQPSHRRGPGICAPPWRLLPSLSPLSGSSGISATRAAAVRSCHPRALPA